MKTESQIESILFVKGEPVKHSTLCEVLDISTEELRNALVKLEQNLQIEGSERGIRLVQTTDTVELAAAPEAHELVETLNKKELTKRLGRAGLETLTIVLYQGPVSRRDIDYIRGVNSTAILRNLTIRGLIERRESEDGKQAIVYQPTTQLLRHLGISSTKELPEHDDIGDKVEQFYETNEPDDVQAIEQDEEQSDTSGSPDEERSESQQRTS
ncbi:MAG: SMC-Scp complex subunit ScpB [Candidatus Paceibacterota bacterium]